MTLANSTNHQKHQDHHLEEKTTQQLRVICLLRLVAVKRAACHKLQIIIGDLKSQQKNTHQLIFCFPTKLTGTKESGENKAHMVPSEMDELILSGWYINHVR